MIAADIASTIPTPVTTITGALRTFVTISWTQPYNGGSVLSAYTILILTSDGLTFAQEMTVCDGTKASIVINNVCVIPISTLMTAPFNLPWGSSIYAKITATNL